MANGITTMTSHLRKAKRVIVQGVVPLVLLGPFGTSHVLFGRADFAAQDDFSESTIMSGVRAASEQCAVVSNTVWAVTKKISSECLKFWATGFDALPAKRVVIYFHGDVFLGLKKRVKATYSPVTKSCTKVPMDGRVVWP